MAADAAPDRRYVRRATRESSQLHPQQPPRGPRFRAPVGAVGAGPQAGGNVASRLSYVQALETQVGTLTETVRGLEQQLAAYSARTQELEARLANGAERAAVQGILRDAEETLTAAEAQVRGLQEQAQRQAGEIVGKAQFQANEMIAAVSSQIAEIEAEAAETTKSHEANALRSQIRDLMRLRETILTSIRSAVDGFGDQLDELEEPLFESGTALTAVPTPAEEAGPAAEQFAVSLLVRPVDGVVEASGIEHGLSEAGADAHLIAVEGSTAEYAVRGLSPDALRTATDRLFPGAECKWVAADRMQVVLTSAKAS